MNKAIRNTTSIKKNNKITEYTIIIVAAGSGCRMKSFGVKSLIKLTPQLTILQNQLNIIKQNLRYNPDIILVAGFEFDKMAKFTPESIIIIENENFANTNVVRSIGMGLRAAKTEHVIIVYGDLVFNKYAFPFLPLFENSVLVIDTSHTMTKNEVGCIINDNMVEHVWYDLPNKWAQIMLLTGKELQLAKSISWNKKYFNCFGCEMINEIIKKGGKFKVSRPRKLRINDVDSTKDLTIAQQIIKNQN